MTKPASYKKPVGLTVYTVMYKAMLIRANGGPMSSYLIGLVEADLKANLEKDHGIPWGILDDEQDVFEFNPRDIPNICAMKGGWYRARNKIDTNVIIEPSNNIEEESEND
jgi:hypothetical protein